ncbi:hypothetical protein NKDENANG_02189 [Candidatus Entotheonellaceae bacterium PAL068K]
MHVPFATQISDLFMPLLRPKYVARIETQVVTDETPESEIGILYPDVEVIRTPQVGTQTSGEAGNTSVVATSSQPETTPANP